MLVRQSASVGRKSGVFLVRVSDWDAASRDSLCALGSGGTVSCTSGGVTRELMPSESRLLDLVAVARSRDGRLDEQTVAKWWTPAQTRSSGAVKDCEQFDPILFHRAKMEEEKDNS